uniref:Eukaryotic translation initiation factor 3 subunit M n=1 Tax=Hemiselmis tepida TaxID=464990 RepID=A0A7S0VVX8_9CRYP|mmetsp:Transcript_26882/g.68279  ORF Transcript_26882/g.68279 Transcript_26882/m.68279 type:complete len:406 (+) Transcript_26882:51-1268(+)|eukprot:CAMPEP_0174930184 /NCGR_PEP_ID=MMETSP1355-20121228/30615_1 /TAXON_ID=464990 /ORGANISM="Hemiselmis tepida, Strain CCMP443" /LENGTH=405 /DNA_ID=CAMNT_0016176459 /DNA_START=46 /DNA_END=1263 /DNA_ORIENTATION=-
MSTFIHAAVSDEGGIADPALDLARHIKALTGQDPASVDKISDEKSLELAMDNIPRIIEGSQDATEAEGVLNVVCWLFQRVLENNTAPANSVALVDKFVGKLAADPKMQPTLRLKMLGTVYNVLGGNGMARYNAFLAMVKFAAAAGEKELMAVAPECEGLEDKVAEWGVPVAKARELYTAIYTAMDAHKNKAGSHLYRRKFLATFQGSKDAAQAKKEAAQVVVDAISDAKVFLFDDCVALDAISALQGDAEYGKLHELLVIFRQETLPAYNKWAAANGALAQKLGLKGDDMLYKMRVLSLCSLCASSRVVKYADVAACMEIPEGDVEKWMIKAFTTGLVDAKMDQTTRTLVVAKCQDRVFGAQQWEGLRDKLVSWRNNMKDIMGMIDQARQRQHMQAERMMQQQAQ